MEEMAMAPMGKLTGVKSAGAVPRTRGYHTVEAPAPRDMS